MAKKLSSVLGVDIGSHSIKVCEVKAQGKKAVVTALGTAPTPEGAVDHTGVYNPEAVGAAIKQAIQQCGAKSPSIVLSVAGLQSVLVRKLDVPRMDPNQELKSHMEWEINRSIPFAETTIQSDYKVIADTDPSSPNMEVVMAMATQTAVDTLVDCVKKAGRKPAAIDVQPLGIARTLSENYEDMYGGESVCVVDFGHVSTNINIYRGSSLMLPRPVPLGGEMITRAVCDALGLASDEGERVKSEELTIPATAQASMGGFGMDFGGGTTTSFDAGAANPFMDASPTQAFQPAGYEISPITGLPEDLPAANPFADPAEVPFDAPVAPVAPAPVEAPLPVAQDPRTTQILSAVSPILEELVSEIRRSIDYYSSQGGTVNRILLCGGSSKLKGLAGYVSRSISIPAEVLDSTKNISVSAKNAAGDSHPEFAVAIGNGLHILFD